MYFDMKSLSFSTILVLLLSYFVAYRKHYLSYDWWIFIPSAFLVFCFIRYHWSRRWLYYYASKFDGPFSLPLIGNAYYFLGPFEDVTEKAFKIANDNSDIFRFWIGPDLYVIDSRPDHVEVILTKCLEKAPAYKIVTGDIISESILLSPVNQWKRNRKLINHTFSPAIMKSFQDKFVESSKILVDSLEDKCGHEFNIHPFIWRSTIEMSCGEIIFELKSQYSNKIVKLLVTLLDTDRSSFGNFSQYMSKLMRCEELFVLRLTKPWLYPTFFWQLSPLYKETDRLVQELRIFVDNIVEMKKSQHIDDEIVKSQFLNHLLTNETKFTEEKELTDEINLMLIASTETTAATQCFLLLVLGIMPEIQQKIYEELYAIFGDSERDATLEDLNRMDYLERAIKETMRLFPAIPIAARFVDRDLEIDNYLFPKGSTIVVPIAYIHRTQKLWENPLHFDPDRFLPDEIKRRHRYAYIPFSVGPRNCPGNLYGMISMKIALSTFVRHYKVISCNYERVEDIIMTFNIVIKADKDFNVVLEKRS